MSLLAEVAPALDQDTKKARSEEQAIDRESQG